MKRLAIQLFENESIVTSGFATRSGLFFSKTGRLVLTNKRLLFVNRRGTKTFAAYHLSEVIHVERCRAIGGLVSILVGILLAIIFLPPLLLLLLLLLFKNAIRVTFSDQTSKRFIVWNKNRWIRLIETEGMEAQRDAREARRAEKL